MVTITRKSPVSGKMRSKELDITKEQYQAWLTGAKIQDAMPNLSPGDREFILTGITDDEWDEIFAKDEEED